MKYRSLVGGAIGAKGFEPGDEIIPPSTKKADEWLAAGLIEPVVEGTLNPDDGQLLSPTQETIST